MRRRIRSYLALTSFLYRLLLFLLIPLGVIAVQQLLNMVDFTFCVLLVTLVMMFAEVMLDYSVFGAVATKEGSRLEYLKTSSYGMILMKNALSMNLIRVFLESSAIVVLSAMVFYGLKRGEYLSEGTLWICADMLLLEYVVTVTLITIGRFFDGWMANMFIGSVGIYLMTGGAIQIYKYVYGMMIFLLITAVIVSVLSVSIVMKRVRAGYYDKAA